jgi:hypothetical protein
MHMPVNRQTFCFFPASDSAYVTPQIGCNFFPGIQPLAITHRGCVGIVFFDEIVHDPELIRNGHN